MPSVVTKYQVEILRELRGVREGQLRPVLDTVRIFKASSTAQREEDFALREEFKAWDRLSDEALSQFERGL